MGWWEKKKDLEILRSDVKKAVVKDFLVEVLRAVERCLGGEGGLLIGTEAEGGEVVAYYLKAGGEVEAIRLERNFKPVGKEVLDPWVHGMRISELALELLPERLCGKEPNLISWLSYQLSTALKRVEREGKGECAERLKSLLVEITDELKKAETLPSERCERELARIITVYSLTLSEE